MAVDDSRVALKAREGRALESALRRTDDPKFARRVQAVPMTHRGSGDLTLPAQGEARCPIVPTLCATLATSGGREGSGPGA